jgi:hypothetical protein
MGFDTILTWIANNRLLALGLGALSVLAFLGTLALVPILVTRMPSDYFTRPRRERDYASNGHSVFRDLLVLFKNLLGVLLMLAGIAMLLLPGQGILTIFIGVMLTDFPGKFRLERWLVSRAAVLHAINWIRDRANRPPLEAPPDIP